MWIESIFHFCHRHDKKILLFVLCPNYLKFLYSCAHHGNCEHSFRFHTEVITAWHVTCIEQQLVLQLLLYLQKATVLLHSMRDRYKPAPKWDIAASRWVVCCLHFPCFPHNTLSFEINLLVPQRRGWKSLEKWCSSLMVFNKTCP